MKPGATLTMHVAPGEPSRVAVLAVDEGILQVARYKNPDPLGFFFQKRMLEVETTQILDLILPDFKRFLALAAPGGDADGGFAQAPESVQQEAQAAGRVLVGRDRRRPRRPRSQATSCPTTSTARLRIVAIGASARRMGVAEAATEVKGDFILTPNVPAMAAPGDEFIVSVGVFNNTHRRTGPIRARARSPGRACRSSGRRASICRSRRRRKASASSASRPTRVLGAAALTFTARRGPAEARIEESVERAPGRRLSGRS